MAALRALRGGLLHCAERSRVRGVDVLSPTPLKRLHELLPARPWAADFSEDAPLRSCFQWLFHPDCDVLNFPPPPPLHGHARTALAVGVGQDGNPEYVPGYRRMWVSGSVRFERPFFLHDTVDKTTAVVDIVEKPTRSQGDIVFVERRSQMDARPSSTPFTSSTALSSSSGGLGGSLSEATTHAYLPGNSKNRASSGTATKMEDPFRLPPDIADGRPISPPGPRVLTKTIAGIDSSLLFKYSALTYNAHKIHYDLEHATDVEGYPGLVVHGPLLASFLLDAYQQEWCHGAENLDDDDAFSGFEFRYRGKAPLFLGSDVHLVAWQSVAGGDPDGAVSMAARDDLGRTVMEAIVMRI